MKRQRQLLRALYTDESGQDLIEYSLIIALVALLAIASIGTLGTHIRDYVFNNIVTPLQGI